MSEAGAAAPPAVATDGLQSAGPLPESGSRQPLVWSNARTGSFDNFGDAMRILYVMSSGDQWELPMYTLMGATEEGVAPMRNDFSANALFSLLWMFFGFILAINLFVGVVVDNFSRMQKEGMGSAVMTAEQQQWVATMTAVVKRAPLKVVRPPTGGFRLALYQMLQSRAFDGFITTVIVSNVAVMSFNYWGIEQHAAHAMVYERATLGFSIVYYAEASLKLVAMSPRGYFGDAWNRFDFFLVCTSLLDQFAEEFLEQYLPIPPMLLRVLRILRILRILRLLKGAKELRNLIVTMVLSFPSLFNVASLLSLIIFIYSVLGVQLFTFVSVSGGGGGLTASRNFVSFGSTSLLLFQVAWPALALTCTLASAPSRVHSRPQPFRLASLPLCHQCLTGDGWSALMADTMVTEESGECSAAMGDCGSKLAVPYFISFQVIGSFVFLNLVVAVILENFGNLYNTDTDLVSAQDIETFSETWAEFDPDATNYIPSTQMVALLLRLPPPLGLKGKSEQQARKLCLLLRVPQHEGSIAFSEVLKEIVENNYFNSSKDTVDQDEFRDLVPHLQLPSLKHAPVERSHLASLPTVMAKAESTSHFYALHAIKGAVQRWRNRSSPGRDSPNGISTPVTKHVGGPTPDIAAQKPSGQAPASVTGKRSQEQPGSDGEAGNAFDARTPAEVQADARGPTGERSPSSIQSTAKKGSGGHPSPSTLPSQRRAGHNSPDGKRAGSHSKPSKKRHPAEHRVPPPGVLPPPAAGVPSYGHSASGSPTEMGPGVRRSPETGLVMRRTLEAGPVIRRTPEQLREQMIALSKHHLSGRLEPAPPPYYHYRSTFDPTWGS